MMSQVVDKKEIAFFVHVLFPDYIGRNNLPEYICHELKGIYETGKFKECKRAVVEEIVEQNPALNSGW